MIKTASLCLWISGLGFGIPGIYGIWSVLKGKGIAYVMGFSTYGNGPFEKIGVHTTIPLLIVMLIIMNRIAENIRNDQRVDTNDIESIVDFLKTFADKCHHGKEENALFPALVEAGIPKEGGPIGVMLHEHAVGREYINEISTKNKTI